MRWFLLLLVLYTARAGAQTQADTIAIMQYNLLYYGSSANPTATKNPWLHTIINYVQPDVFGANEIRSDTVYVKSIKDSVLGAGWSCGTFSNVGNQDRVNMLFYKTSKFTLKNQAVVCSYLRDVMAYKLAYNDTITIPHDTTYLTVIVGHLKADPDSASIATRVQEAQAITDYIHNNGPGNFIFQGDMNVYKSTEDDYQVLVNNVSYGATLNDPINRPGTWHDGATFTDIHTQSTRKIAVTGGDGGASGGLDDRFDQILATQYILGDSAGVHYLAGTYHCVGQDGNHFNLALTDAPTNTAAPDSIIQTLFNMSDHLPVTAKFLVHATRPVTSAIANAAISGQTPTVINPAQGHQLRIFTNSWEGHQLTYTVRDVLGQTVANEMVKAAGANITVALPEILGSNLFYLSITDATGNIVAMPVLVK